MDRKIIIGIAVIIIFIGGILGYFLLNNIKLKENISDNSTKKDVENNNDINISLKGKILVVYYSATGTTKRIAQEIANNLDADIFEIEPVDIYTKTDLDWTDKNSRVFKEHDDESLRNIKLKNTKVTDWNNYNTVLIGYPIWWGIAAWPVNNFIKDNDFNNKIIIPFCTSASSGLGKSDKLLADEAKGGTWKEGHRFSSSTSTRDIKTWTDSLK